MSPDRQPELDARFRDPPTSCRSVPFWAWNTRMDPAEVAAQIRSMKDQGMGGFFMHSRDGLETPYMGPEWLEAVRTAIRTAEETGMAAWLYDEDRWPSGSAGGKVPGQGDEYRAKGLTLEIRDWSWEPECGVVALFRAWTAGLRLERSERLDSEQPWVAEAGSQFLVFRIEVGEPDEWFNGETPPDNLNPAAVQAFIDLNYRPYREAIGGSFGTTVPGIFTDEPSVHDRHSRFEDGLGWIPWTGGFAAFFRDRRGYDPYGFISQVFFDGPESARIRHDYWRTVTELFSETYTRRLGEWCAENRLQFTGHFLWENHLGTATRTSGAIMPHYRYQQMPGIDMLCEQADETITVKQCSSVANQYGRPRVISELYGCVGWEFSFEGQKWLGDWQFAMGVNVRSQHLALYSLRGCRKRDYPPVFNYNNAWWRHNRIVEDYFARLSAALTLGVPVRDLLIVHPASTAWCRLGSNPRGFTDRGLDRNLAEINDWGAGFNGFLRAILGAHHDFDLGDETIMAEAGKAEGPLLRVKRAVYKVVLLPAMDTLLRSTMVLLRSFLEGGGRLVAVRPVATMVEGVPSLELESLLGHRGAVVADNQAAAIQALETFLPRRVSLRGRHQVEDPELLCMHRLIDSETEILFAVNTDRAAARQTRVEIVGPGTVEELDALTGTIQPLAACVAGSRIIFMADFAPAGSRLYRIRRIPSPALTTGGQATQPASVRPSTLPDFRPPPNLLVNPSILRGFGPLAQFRRTEPNALVLDRCCWRMRESSWSEEMEVWQAQRAIRSALGMRQVFGNGLTQRYLWAAEAHPGDGTPVEFRYAFGVGEVPEKTVRLALERPGDFRITLNGAAVPAKPDGWFLDKSFETVPLSGLVAGRNELVLACAYRNDMEVEDCFLLGDFAVDSQRAIVREPERLRFGDWCLQGYPHYCGSMVYGFEFDGPEERAVLRLGEYSAVTVEIRLNGRVAGQIPWRAANRVDLGGKIGAGRNFLEIEVVGSPRNLLGPFHLARGKVAFNEWSAFRTEGREQVADHVLHPYGLFGQVILTAD